MCAIQILWLQTGGWHFSVRRHGEGVNYICRWKKTCSTRKFSVANRTQNVFFCQRKSDAGNGEREKKCKCPRRRFVIYVRMVLVLVLVYTKKRKSKWQRNQRFFPISRSYSRRGSIFECAQISFSFRSLRSCAISCNSMCDGWLPVFGLFSFVHLLWPLLLLPPPHEFFSLRFVVVDRLLSFRFLHYFSVCNTHTHTQWNGKMWCVLFWFIVSPLFLSPIRFVHVGRHRYDEGWEWKKPPTTGAATLQAEAIIIIIMIIYRVFNIKRRQHEIREWRMCVLVSYTRNVLLLICVLPSSLQYWSVRIANDRHNSVDRLLPWWWRLRSMHA